MFEALKGSRWPDSPPEEDNRFVVEADQGKGTAVDFTTDPTLPVDKRVNPDIEGTGYAGSLAHHLVWLIVNSDGENHNYADDILPRLKILLGRDPIFGDQWYDGTRFKTYNGDSWIG
jgi:hypothetical protein